jgi:hypothetical protein
MLQRAQKRQALGYHSSMGGLLSRGLVGLSLRRGCIWLVGKALRGLPPVERPEWRTVGMSGAATAAQVRCIPGGKRCPDLALPQAGELEAKIADAVIQAEGRHSGDLASEMAVNSIQRFP